MDTVLEWLSLPADQRPDLVTLYFDEPDHTGHAEGPGPGQEVSSFRTSLTTSCLRSYRCPPKSHGGGGGEGGGGFTHCEGQSHETVSINHDF